MSTGPKYMRKVTDTGILLLEDVGGPGDMSLTNGIDQAIASCAKDHEKSASDYKAILYRDSDGVWDECLLDAEGRFNAFMANGATRESIAIAKCLRRHEERDAEES